MKIMAVLARVVSKWDRQDSPPRERVMWLTALTADVGALAQAHNKGCDDDEFADIALGIAARALGAAQEFGGQEPQETE